MNSLFGTLDAIFGENQWQSIYAEALNLWAAASEMGGTDTVLSFSVADDSGVAFDANGQQGDIRFGAHAFDGAGGTLAHAYFAPPNGNTAAGDAHIDEAENWQDLRSSTSSQSATIQSGPGLSSGTILGGRGLAVSSLQLGLSLVSVDTAESTQHPKRQDDVHGPKLMEGEVTYARDERVSDEHVAPQQQARITSSKFNARSEAADRALENLAAEDTLDGVAIPAALGLWSALHDLAM